MRRRDREQARPYEEAYNQGREDERRATSSRRTSSSRRDQAARVVAPAQPQRVIVGTMAFAVVFTLLGLELKAAKGGAAKGKVTPVTVIIGGGVATIVLLVVSHAGDPGAELAEGLAVVTVVASVLGSGGPVWEWVSKLVGAHPAAAPTQATNPQAPGFGVGANQTAGMNPPLNYPSRPGQPQ